MTVKVDASLHGELRGLARSAMRSERCEHTLQPTALAHEAYLRLTKERHLAASHRSHFLAAASVVMRRILVEHARAKLAQKRGGGRRRVVLFFEPVQPGCDLLELHEALEKLGHVNTRAARVTEMKFFGGMTHIEIGHYLGVTARTVQDDWKFAKAWLYRAMSTV